MFDIATNKRLRPGSPPPAAAGHTDHGQTSIYIALAEAVSDQGYRAVTIDEVVRRAGIPRSAFDQRFSSKEDCFLALHQHATEQALERVVSAAGRFSPWPRQVGAGLAALLDYLAAEPALARACLVEVLSAGPAARHRHDQLLRFFASFLRSGRTVSSQNGQLPDSLEEAIAGGVFWIIYRQLFLGRELLIEELCPKLAEFALRPYVGAKSARQVARSSSSVEGLDGHSGAKKLVIQPVGALFS